MSFIMASIVLEEMELFTLELGKVDIYDFVYSRASTDINQSAPNMFEMFLTIRSWMGLIMDLIRPELLELSAFELDKLPYLSLFIL